MSRQGAESWRRPGAGGGDVAQDGVLHLRQVLVGAPAGPVAQGEAAGRPRDGPGAAGPAGGPAGPPPGAPAPARRAGGTPAAAAHSSLLRASKLKLLRPLGQDFGWPPVALPRPPPSGPPPRRAETCNTPLCVLDFPRVESTRRRHRFRPSVASRRAPSARVRRASSWIGSPESISKRPRCSALSVRPARPLRWGSSIRPLSTRRPRSNAGLQPLVLLHHGAPPGSCSSNLEAPKGILPRANRPAPRPSSRHRARQLRDGAW